MTLRDGTPLRLVLRPAARVQLVDGRVSSRWLLYAIVFPLCLGLLAYGVARMTTRPLGRLARAATALGADINQPPLPENGPSEVRHAAAAFNVMQARIRSYVEERTQMLGAIAHDLQTPRHAIAPAAGKSRGRRVCATSWSATWPRCRA